MSGPVLMDFEQRPSAFRYMLRGAYPGARPRRAMPDLRARWQGHRVDPGELQSFLDVVGAKRGEALPLLHPHVFGFRLPMAVLTHPRFPVPIWGVLQIRNHIVQHRPIALDAALDFETRLARQRFVEKGCELDLHTTVRVGGLLAWESVNTFYARGMRGEAVHPPSPLARSPEVPTTLVAEWTMPDDAHFRFGSFTGDYNGIHSWDWYARMFGFPRALYHPPRVLAQCLAQLAIDTKPPVRLDVWVKGPVHHGAAVRLRADRRDHETVFAAFAGREARPSIVARLTRREVEGWTGRTSID